MSRLRKEFFYAAAAIGLLAATAVMASRAAKDDAKPFTDVAAELATLRSEVADLRDRQKIKEVYVNYGRGIDRLDEQSYRKAFWPDARIGYGTTESITPDDHWNVHMQKWHKGSLKSWGHFLGNESIDIDGDTAHVEIYVVAMPMSKDEAAPGILWGGRYVDRLTRKNGEWRISAREYVPFFAMKTERIYKWLDGYTSGDPACAGEAWSWQGRKDVRYVRPLAARTSKESGTPCAK